MSEPCYTREFVKECGTKLRTKIGDENYDPNCDVVEPFGEITIKDIVYMSTHPCEGEEPTLAGIPWIWIVVGVLLLIVFVLVLTKK